MLPSSRNGACSRRAQIRGHRAASEVGVEEADDVRGGADRQQLAIRHRRRGTSGSRPSAPACPTRSRRACSESSARGTPVVGVAKRGHERGERHPAQDQREDRRRQQHRHDGVDDHASGVTRLRSCSTKQIAARVADQVAAGAVAGPLAPRRARSRPACRRSCRMTISAAPASSSASAITVDVERAAERVRGTAVIDERLQSGDAERHVDHPFAPRPAERVRHDDRHRAPARAR